MKKYTVPGLVFLAIFGFTISVAQVELPKSLKDVLPLYPKAKVLTAMETSDGSHAVLEASGSSKEIASFYKKAMESKGWNLEMEMHQERTSMVNFKKAKQVLSIMADATDKAKTNIIVTLAKK
ncbi:MAG: hypothetical protein WHX93_06705 [bacterium]